MPAGVFAEVYGGFATIDFVDPSLKGPALNRLLQVGGPGSIETLTREGPRKKYRVPEGNANAAGLLDILGAHKGDTGHAQRLAEASSQGARPTQPTAKGNTYVGATPTEDVLAVTSAASTVGSAGPVRAAGERPEFPEGEPSAEWSRREIDAYARAHGANTTYSANKGAALDALRGREL